jgi:hypothetical protein
VTDEELQAASCKYNCDRIIRLPSGRFALYAHWDNEEGIPFKAIGTLEEIGPMIASVDEIENHYAKIIAERSKNKGNELLAKLGLGKAKEPIKRRV